MWLLVWSSNLTYKWRLLLDFTVALGQREQSEVDIESTDSHCQAPPGPTAQSPCTTCWTSAVFSARLSGSQCCATQHTETRMLTLETTQPLLSLKEKQIHAKCVHLGPPSECVSELFGLLQSFYFEVYEPVEKPVDVHEFFFRLSFSLCVYS